MNPTVNEFYHSLADYYNEIFPPNPKTLEFIFSLLKEFSSPTHILDIGCATGQFAFALSRMAPQFHIKAIEPDEKMVEMAALLFKNYEHNLSIARAGMMDLPTLFPSNSFHSILCLGNTLVHLQSHQEIRTFFEYTHDSLDENGIFIMQIVNYFGIQPHQIHTLPLIQTPLVSFSRHYEYIESLHKIRFFTRLIPNNSEPQTRNDNIYENELYLYPLQYNEISQICQKVGFKSINIYGNFNREPWIDSSPALILTARK